MTADAAFHLCKISQECSRRLQCARAQLTPGAYRQAECTPTGRGDSCKLFFDFAPLQRRDPKTPARAPHFAGGDNFQTHGAACTASSGGQQVHYIATADTLAVAPTTLRRPLAPVD